MAQTLLDTDNFAGTEDQNLTTYSANWSVFSSTQYNTLRIRGTPGFGAYGANYRTGQTWTNNHWCEVVIDATNVASTRFGILLRADTAASGSSYFGGSDPGTLSGNYFIGKFTTGTLSLISSAGFGMSGSDVINFEADSTTLTLRVNSSIIVQITDSTYTTGGSPGIVNSDDSNDRTGGSWRAGSVTSSSANAPFVSDAATVADTLTTNLRSFINVTE